MVWISDTEMITNFVINNGIDCVSKKGKQLNPCLNTIYAMIKANNFSFFTNAEGCK